MGDELRRLFAYLLDHVPMSTLLRAATHARTGAGSRPRPTRSQCAAVAILMSEIGAKEDDT